MTFLIVLTDCSSLFFVCFQSVCNCACHYIYLDLNWNEYIMSYPDISDIPSQYGLLRGALSAEAWGEKCLHGTRRRPQTLAVHLNCVLSCYWYFWWTVVWLQCWKVCKAFDISTWRQIYVKSKGNSEDIDTVIDACVWLLA